jgi:hypothetical protein
MTVLEESVTASADESALAGWLRRLH